MRSSQKEPMMGQAMEIQVADKGRHHPLRGWRLLLIKLMVQTCWTLWGSIGALLRHQKEVRRLRPHYSALGRAGPNWRRLALLWVRVARLRRFWNLLGQALRVGAPVSARRLLHLMQAV